MCCVTIGLYGAGTGGIYRIGGLNRGTTISKERVVKRIAVVAVLLVFVAGNAFAVDLVNKDSKKYDVKIHSGASTTSSSIESNTTMMSVCSECKIEVVGVGEMEASGSDKVIIKDGKLDKE